MYLEAILYAHEQGVAFRTQDWNQTEHAVRIWRFLHSLGVAREVAPFSLDKVQEVRDYETGETRLENRYKGVYIVDPPSATS